MDLAAFAFSPFTGDCAASPRSAPVAPKCDKRVQTRIDRGQHEGLTPSRSWAPGDLGWREIPESRSVLEKALGQTVWAFGYPFGNAATVTGRGLRLAEQAGFRCAFMNAGGGLGAKINRFALPRVHVTADMSLAEFEAHISGFYRSLRKKLLGGDEREAVVGA